MNDAMLIAEGLGHAYRPDRWVFRDYSLTVRPASVFAILGQNGCGKSTLLKALMGQLRTSEGTVRRTGKIAFVPQLFQVSFDYTVHDIVVMGRAGRLGLFERPSTEDHKAVREALERVGLGDCEDRPFRELSGGMRQLAIFARALVSKADILVLDEPTSALDLRNQSLILEWIRRLRDEEKLCIVFSTHHPNHVLAVADDALLMLGTQEYVCGRAAAVLTEANLRALYQVQLRRIPFEHEGKQHEAIVVP